MLATVKVLVEGYSNADKPADRGEEIVRPTITLVRDGSSVVIVDPGNLERPQVLLDALAKEGLTPEDINIVCITQSHIAHSRNTGLFPKARILEYYGLWREQTIEKWPDQFSPHIQVVKTPGHSETGITLMVATVEGIVAVCGDVFWRENFPATPREDIFALNPEALGKSQSIVMQMADWIIPGHGPMFKVKRGLVGGLRNSISNTLKKAPVCKKCERLLLPKETCICRPWLCFRDCECDFDCLTCSCWHKRK